MDRVSTWRAKGKGGPNHDVNSYEYFIKNDCVSCGYSFPYADGREHIQSLSDFKKFWHDQNGEYKSAPKWNRQGVHFLFDNLKKGDFIWTRKAGQYYVAEVPDSPENLFYFDAGSDATAFDCSAQLNNIHWIKVGAEADVPGSVSVYNFYSSIGRIDVRENLYKINDIQYTATGLFSAVKAGVLSPKGIKKINFNRHDLFSLIRYSDTEDLVALWLFDKFNYIVIPSTNKLSTQKYEFVLLNASKNLNGKYRDSKNIYIQVKNGAIDLKSKDYTSLLKDDRNEVWLVTTSGRIDNLSVGGIMRLCLKNSKVQKSFWGIEELLNFAFNPEKKNIIPDNILFWVLLCNRYMS
ncbi:hypothetical protein [Lactiplantibacillus plantarum]|uniref:hypothetical protein n=1 Tax=Lactiplantibacillus plantarum TaxID=1590 RepID=UPI00062D66F8|nr:hypothetical protein [Lactiplantibacillus plantarum]KLD41754.1 hypothetical protein WU67_06855 [Lactiplantibacillus plantarum]KLD58514.1 hypothetical protein WP50_25625 [Lactiplantibacillus plantarum]MCG3566999.1 hypothetical protein [Lactiplantibacillus plantarum]MCG3570010.1 hypothetical protein [Lactiplantibacillus plantarum]MCK6240196.1 hypothetical protein [Lactiplantibacillus plantarum]